MCLDGTRVELRQKILSWLGLFGALSPMARATLAQLAQARPVCLYGLNVPVPVHASAPGIDARAPRPASTRAYTCPVANFA